MNKKDVQMVLKKLNVKPKKHLVARKIILESDLKNNDVVLEIGPGLGALTESLVETAKKVYAIEIESKFCSLLEQKFSNYDNIEIINGDILKVEIPSCDKVVSNIPYSITGPIFEKIFYKPNPPMGILTIQKSLAERIFYSKDYKKFSRITVTLNSFMEPASESPLSRYSFYPVPKIDLALIKLKPKDNLSPILRETENIKYFLKFIAGIMPYKNKNIANALELYLKKPKVEIIQTLEKHNFDNKKLFYFKIEEFLELSKIFLDSDKKN
jgi:16S rRNA (adenine1518-N6/adenine1519-N6)-dimethyltransferase